MEEDVLFACLICMDEFCADDGNFCGLGHFICHSDFRLFVQQVASEENEEVLREKVLPNTVLCPQCHVQLGPAIDGEEKAGFKMHQIARQVSLDTYEAVAFARDRVMRSKHRQEAFQEMRQNRTFSRSKSNEQRRLEAEMREANPHAVQCRECGFGPIIPEGCSDMRRHHGENGVSNVCPRCGWFGATRQEWPRWNGRLPNDGENNQNSINQEGNRRGQQSEETPLLSNSDVDDRHIEVCSCGECCDMFEMGNCLPFVNTRLWSIRREDRLEEIADCVENIECDNENVANVSSCIVFLTSFILLEVIPTLIIFGLDAAWFCLWLCFDLAWLTLWLLFLSWFRALLNCYRRTENRVPSGIFTSFRGIDIPLDI